MADFVSIDVETANAFMGSICQIGAVRFRNGVEVEHINWLIDPQDYFDEINISIHGITSDKVAGCPAFADKYADLCSFVQDEVVVCHTHFDRVSLARAADASHKVAINCEWLDSAKVARRTWADIAYRGYGLASLAARLGISFQHHDALQDARAAGQVLLHAIDESGRSLEDWLRHTSRPITSADVRRTGDGDGPLLGHSIVFTGALQMRRRHAADHAHELGAAVEAGVTKNTTMLIVGDQDLQKLNGQVKSAKHRKAEMLIAGGQPIRIVGEGDFLAFHKVP